MILHKLKSSLKVICAAATLAGGAVAGQLETGSTVQEIRGGAVVEGFAGVVVFVSPIGQICTGSIIAPDVILTAAHCLRQLFPLPVNSGQARFIIGHSIDADNNAVIEPLYDGQATWIAHPDFDFSAPAAGASTANADIGVIKTPLPLPSVGHEDYLRLYADVDSRLVSLDAYGGGLFTYSGKFDGQIRTARFDVESVKKNHIVIDNRKWVTVCQGDSGGPLIYFLQRQTRIGGLVTGVLSASEKDADEGLACANNDPPNDDSFYSRTNWAKLATVMNAAGVDCPLDSAAGVSYRRCFDTPFINNVPFEGLERGVATAIVAAAIF